MAEEIFIQLGIILFTAFVVSYLVKFLKQPLIIGYIIAGVIISPFIIYSGASKEVIKIFSEFGVAFLLFIVGLHLNPKVIKEIGKPSLIISVVQMIFTFSLTFGISYYFFHFNILTSAFLGVALIFSSTIIVTKLLSDKGHLDSLYGKISVGTLIFEDLVAVGVLMFISSISKGTDFSSFATHTFLMGGGLILVLFLLGFYVFPMLIRKVAKYQELLFLFAIFWCFAVAALFVKLGFTVEIGALIAGVVLSISPYSTEISSKVHPLMDFFLIIFFIILGVNIQISNLGSILMVSIVLSLIALIFKPFVLMSSMAFLGYTKRTNFLVGTTLSQISEFSVIVLTLGLSMNYIMPEVLSSVALTLVLTTFFSTYFIIYSNPIYNRIKNFASFFERKKVSEKREIKEKYDAILFGYNRIGFSILHSLKRIKKDYLVVDFNPDTISNLEKWRIPRLYGDINDVDLLNSLPLDKIKIGVSTIPDFDTNSLLIEQIRLVNKDAIIIVIAHQIQDALELYEKGASYVLTPHFLGGEYVAKMIIEERVSKKGYKEERERHLKLLKKMVEQGHEHPRLSRG